MLGNDFTALSYAISPHFNINLNETANLPNPGGHINMTITFEVLWSVATGDPVASFKDLFERRFLNSPARPAGDSWVFSGFGMAPNGGFIYHKQCC